MPGVAPAGAAAEDSLRVRVCIRSSGRAQLLRKLLPRYVELWGRVHIYVPPEQELEYRQILGTGDETSQWEVCRGAFGPGAQVQAMLVDTILRGSKQARILLN